jgi:hypothetical protein
MDTLRPVFCRLNVSVSGDRSMGLRAVRAFGGSAVLAGWEYAMQSRAKFGLCILSFACFGTAAAHAPGVTHTYVNGEPVITIRLVQPERVIPQPQPVDSAPPAAAHSEPEALLDDPSAANPAADPFAGAELAAPAGEGAVSVPLTPEPAIPEEAISAAPPEARYPTARPVIKPDSENGMGGSLDLVPPAEAEPSNPKPMRLNSIDKPRRSAERPARNTSVDSRPRQPRQRAEAAPAPAPYDPLDEALPPVVVAPAQAPTSMQLPVPTAELSPPLAN